MRGVAVPHHDSPFATRSPHELKPKRHPMKAMHHHDHPAATETRRALFITDIDGTLLHEGGSLVQPGLDTLKDALRTRPHGVLWGVATGRRLALVQEAFQTHGLPAPDVVMPSVGTEIHHALDGSSPDLGWANHLAHDWDADAVREAIRRVPGLTPQAARSQGRFKVSFHVTTAEFSLARLDEALQPWSAHAHAFVTRGTHLDILPRRASKGQAIEWFARHANVPSTRIVVAGDSGNDLDMLARFPAIVVGNHSDELLPLRNKPSIYFSPKPATLGVLDGLRHVGLLSPPEHPAEA